MLFFSTAQATAIEPFHALLLPFTELHHHALSCATTLCYHALLLRSATTLCYYALLPRSATTLCYYYAFLPRSVIHSVETYKLRYLIVHSCKLPIPHSYLPFRNSFPYMYRPPSHSLAPSFAKEVCSTAAAAIFLPAWLRGP